VIGALAGSAGRRLRRPLRRLVVQPPDRFDRLVAAFSITEAWKRQRVRDIVRAFLTGYNAMACADAPAAVHAALAGLDDYHRPFGYEGAAMGFGPWALVHGRSLEDVEREMAAFSPRTVYQNYVGLGWWLAMRHRLRPRRLPAVAERLDHRYRLLVFEGIGFRAGFLSGGDERVTRAFARLGVHGAHVAHQGFGRSLWFTCMDDLGAALRLVGRLPAAHAGDCVSGLGLGCAYSLLDRAAGLPDVLAGVPSGWRPDFLQGAAFGWEARQLADPALFERMVARAPAVRPLVGRALEAVHRAAGDLEAAGCRDGFYQRWRHATRARLAGAAPEVTP
jgi:hypothetical protein